MTRSPRHVLLLLVLSTACKETAAPGTPDAGGRGLLGKWTGVQSAKPGGDGQLAEVEFKPAGDPLSGVLFVSSTSGREGLAPNGFIIQDPGGGASAYKLVVSLLADGGPDESYPLTLTQTTPTHLDGVEQNHHLDGGPFPIYYRFDRK